MDEIQGNSNRKNFAHSTGGSGLEKWFAKPVIRNLDFDEHCFLKLTLLINLRAS